jgi:RNA polymerase sigma-70 factor (ECF subfamily)
MADPGEQTDLPRTRDKAFEILVRQHHRRVLAFALALVQREEVAEDLAQEAFLEAYRKLDQFDPTRDFGRWVRGIVRMKYLEWARQRRPSLMDERTLEQLEAQHRSWDEAWENGSGDALGALRLCLERLQATARQTIEGFYFQRQDCATVASRMGATEAAVKKRLERIRGTLADCVRQRLALAARTGGIES